MVAHALIGSELGNYVVDSLLGEGGMGAVFAGRHKFLGHRVAIKVLHGSYANDESVTQRFFLEAKASIDIGHPNVIKVLDFGRSQEGSLYLVMELLEGLNLRQALAANGPFSEREAVAIIVAVCDGLAAAHRKGITHRDLKPDNVFLTLDNEVKILDFGIAKVEKAGAGTKTGALLGTPVYMAPEQCRDAKLVGPHTDLYATGTILFELVTGRSPFSGELAEVIAKHLFESPPRPSTLAPISPQLEALILECLEKESAARPSSMEVLRDRLRALTTTDSGAPSLPRGAVLTPFRHVTTLSRTTGESRPATPSQRRSAWWAVVLGATLLGGAALLYRSRTPTNSILLPPAPTLVASPTPAVSLPPAQIAPAPSASKSAQVVVRSDPPGATVFVDGTAVGTTPVLLRVNLPKEIALTRRGYRRAKEVLTVPGELTIKLVPEARLPAPRRDHAPDKPVAPPLPNKPTTEDLN